MTQKDGLHVCVIFFQHLSMHMTWYICQHALDYCYRATSRLAQQYCSQILYYYHPFSVARKHGMRQISPSFLIVFVLFRLATEGVGYGIVMVSDLQDVCSHPKTYSAVIRRRSKGIVI